MTKGVAFGNKGVIADVGLSHPITVTPRLTLVPAVATTWTDARYGDRYFGVSAAQSLRSGLAVYHQKSGFNDVSATLSASYMLTDRLILGASAGVTSLVGDNRYSPLVRRETQPSGLLSIGYRF